MSFLLTKSEDEFQGYLIYNYRSKFSPKLYPKVSKIGGRTISPEIDLLGTDTTKSMIVSYESKLLKFKTSDSNYRFIYSGIGQALLYLNCGADVTVLVLGIPNTPARDSSIQKIDAVSNLVDFLAKPMYKFDRFKVWIFDEKTQKFLVEELRFEKPMLTLGTSYYVDSLARRNLLAENFTWTKGKEFLKKYNIPQEIAHPLDGFLRS